MPFNSIFEAIENAQETNDPQLLNEYISRRIRETGETVMAALFSETEFKPDDMYFMLAFGSCLVDAHMASLSEQEKELVQSLKSRLSITVAKVNIPFKPE